MPVRAPQIEREGISGRVFLVGCPRSGTTLLQSMLCGHPDVISFPETFFFALATPTQRLARNLGFASRRSIDALERLEELGFQTDSADRRAIRLRRRAGDFVAILDSAALAQGKRVWVEKTPVHLRYIRYIEKHVPDARFVHIVRSGLGAIPSLYEVTRTFPGDWGGTRSLSACIDRWEQDLRLSARQIHRDNHAFVTYERLASDPESTLSSLCGSLDLQTDADTLKDMLDGRARNLHDITRDEPWKVGVSQVISNKDMDKLAERLSPRERDLVVAAVADTQDILAGIDAA